jgi:hypothetical protein
MMDGIRNNDSADLAILRAVQALDDKLSKALTDQTSQLTAQIQALADRHNHSLIAQEKRNATFADRDRVEAVAEHQHTNANVTQGLIGRMGVVERRLVEISSDVEACRQSIADRTVSFLAGANGYLVTFILMILVATVAAAIARALK